jgi:Predicted nucleic acid-binding protein, contains PIN domain
VQILVDTNILLRRIHRSHPQHRLTRAAIARIVDRGDVLCVTTQNLIECWAVCTRPVESNGFGLLPAAANRILSRIEIAAVRLSDDQDAVYPEWRRLVTHHAVSGKKSHDARLVAAMKVSGVTHVLTFNSDDFQRYEHIVTIHPNEFEKLAP